MVKFYFGLLLSLIWITDSNAQIDTNTIVLINPSFEGEPQCCSTPSGWIDCGWKNESAPDIQPSLSGHEPLFGVTKAPFDGRTYMGMVTRDNDSYERVSQRLSQPMRKGRCYSFSIYLCRSVEYLSASNQDPKKIKPFTTPVVFRIYGGDAYCHQKELLAESVPVENVDWKLFTFELKPTFDMEYFELEAFYKTPVLMPYNGNLLIDKASFLKKIKCPNDKTVVSKPDKKIIPTAATKEDAKTTVASSNGANEKRILKDLDKDKIKIGQIIKIEKLYFKPDSSNIDSSSHAVLEELYEFLVKNPKIKIEIGGHTNSQPTHEYCDKLSSFRAKSVKEYIIAKGISQERVSSRGYGKRNPIAPNDTKAGKALNQRVEIKIISVT
ncbi:MAG: OmpA family protein [Saprospiraceae bacterium]|nr:OmpA family protein [Saprospiraceae bacterium]